MAKTSHTTSAQLQHYNTFAPLFAAQRLRDFVALDAAIPELRTRSTPAAEVAASTAILAGTFRRHKGIDSPDTAAASPAKSRKQLENATKSQLVALGSMVELSSAGKASEKRPSRSAQPSSPVQSGQSGVSMTIRQAELEDEIAALIAARRPFAGAAGRRAAAELARAALASLHEPAPAEGAE